MQRAIEAAGISTITLSCIPDLTAAVGVPRLAAIEHPLGYSVGQPGDRRGQLAVLSAVFEALAGISEPGCVVHLPFEWPPSARRLNAHAPETPPISKYLMKHPWQIPKLLSRSVPAEFQG